MSLAGALISPAATARAWGKAQCEPAAVAALCESLWQKGGSAIPRRLRRCARAWGKGGSVPGGGEESSAGVSVCPVAAKSGAESGSVPGGGEEQRESGSVPGGGEERRGREILQQGRPWRRTRRPARPALAAQLPLNDGPKTWSTDAWCLLQAVWSLEAAEGPKKASEKSKTTSTALQLGSQQLANGK